ncbi:UBX domain-containing protein 5 [Erysiphe neolycopersici]|uniref:UBX domain-containing protein 5 n=1 Tax=Erysiphe neolycopersici TaxID=212602 RepID=A0A420I359_9PEZI|nr:UBX domain-containing protein 5 [Erysiphe neolycopersici]
MSSSTLVQMNEAIEYFKSFTGQRDEVAQRYLGLTENVAEHAIQLFYDSPDLALGLEQPSLNTSSGNTNLSQTQIEPERKKSYVNLVNIDEDDDDDVIISDVRKKVTSKENAVDVEDDESIARRIQAEIYDGIAASTSYDMDGVRAPMERRKEVLVGGGDEDWQGANSHASNLYRGRAGLLSRSGVFNQSPAPSIWESGLDSTSLRQGAFSSTEGVPTTSSKAARLAELFRPPFEIMRQISWETAREQGKAERKWIIVNVQDQSTFDCQQLNRDIWKDPGIKEAIKENFIFVQYSNDDPRASQYIQFYFQNSNNNEAYPHIAIVDPRTGEQVKKWSGRPVPQASDFLMQIYEFLDRYSLDITKKNPITSRKSENSNTLDVEQMTDQQMLDIALQNSLLNSAEYDQPIGGPDNLMKIHSDFEKGKGKEILENSDDVDTIVPKVISSGSAFAKISSKNYRTEPPIGPETTRIQFKHAGGRIVRAFYTCDPILRIYEWLKSEPIEGRSEVEFELKVMGKDLINHLHESINDCGLKNGTVMVEFLESDD